MSNIQPFGTSTDSPTHPLVPIKLFGCTVVDFNVSADWSSQGGSLSCRLIESETDGDRLTIPVLGSPVLFELKNTSGQVVFQHIGIVDSFSRSSSNSKTYSVNLISPLRILDSTSVILDGYTGLGSSLEGTYNLAGLQQQHFGHNNPSIKVDNIAGTGHWWNVSNLINAFGILENDDPEYRVPTNLDAIRNRMATKSSSDSYGGFGFSGRNKDGITLIKLMWALHIGINHLPIINSTSSNGKLLKQKTHGGNLLFGRHNYNLYDPAQWEAIPYYYHFDAIHFYNQVVGKLGPEYRVAGQYKTLTEIISEICNEANLEFFSYIDIYTDTSIGNPTLQENDPYIGAPAIFNWVAGQGGTMVPLKFPLGGNYGGTIRIQTIDKNSFFNANRPFSNIAYNLIGLEVPDLLDDIWTGTSGNNVHPGKRPINNAYHGLTSSGGPFYQTYSDPLDSSGVQAWRGSNVQIPRPEWGFNQVGTRSVEGGGGLPFRSGIFDPNKLSDLKIKSSDISIKLNDFTTMKVITGGYQTRMVTVPRNMLRHYWGDIILSSGADMRTTNDTATDSLGLDQSSTRKIPVVTTLLDPKDIDDFILVDMKNDFGPINVPGVFEQGIYAASLLEIRCAMSSIDSWKAFFEKYKYKKLRTLTETLYPAAKTAPAQNGKTKDELEKSTSTLNAVGGLGYAGVCDALGLGNMFSISTTAANLVFEGNNKSGEPIIPTNAGSGEGSGMFGLGIDLTKAEAEANMKAYVLPMICEKLKEIGDTHYGKSWYAPVPYTSTIEDLDGQNLVGNFKRSWELNDSAYVEPSAYYDRRIPQSNLFISDGKVNPFINYDHNFLSSDTGIYDTSYAQDITNILGKNQKICNFSEYSLDKLCITRFSPAQIGPTGQLIYGSGGNDILHAAPDNLSDNYAFLPLAYDRHYNRAVLPASDILTGQSKRYSNDKNYGVNGSGLIPSGFGQVNTKFLVELSGVGGIISDLFPNIATVNRPFLPGGGPNEIPDISGYFDYGSPNIPVLTHPTWLTDTVTNLQTLNYELDNGRFAFPYVKFTTARVFLPVPMPGMNNSSGLSNISLNGMNNFLGTNVAPSGRQKQNLLTEDEQLSILKPFQACVVPKSFSYPQISTRYVYGPWITNLVYIPFRGKIEYEQDESLVPENFLIPTNFGPFGTYSLNQTSGFTGMNLAAQGRANAIDDFSLFAVEEGSITIPHAPAIKRVGDSLYGLQQVTDIKINVSNDIIETTYSFKTISPKFGKNPRDLEKKLTKISNIVKKIKLR